MFLFASLATIIDLLPSQVENLTQPTFIKFYLPQCPHCQYIAPKFQEASLKFDDVVFAQVECQTHYTACINLKVRGFPTMRLYINNETFDLTGRRDAPAIIQWLSSTVKRAGVVLRVYTPDQLLEQMKKRKQSTYFIIKTDQPLFYQERMQQILADITVGHHLAQFDQVEAVRDGVSILQNISSTDQLKSFILANKHPFTPKPAVEIISDLRRSGSPFYVVCVESDQLKKDATSLAREHRATVVIADPHKDETALLSLKIDGEAALLFINGDKTEVIPVKSEEQVVQKLGQRLNKERGKADKELIKQSKQSADKSYVWLWVFIALAVLAATGYGVWKKEVQKRQMLLAK